MYDFRKFKFLKLQKKLTSLKNLNFFDFKKVKIFTILVFAVLKKFKFLKNLFFTFLKNLKFCDFEKSLKIKKFKFS